MEDFITGRTEDIHGNHTGYFYADLNLRDMFAAFALTLGEGVWPGDHLPENADKLAANAYTVADAMLKARVNREQIAALDAALQALREKA